MVIELYERARQEKIEIIDLDDEYKPGDLCWLETPVNPAGTSKNIQYYADKVCDTFITSFLILTICFIDPRGRWEALH